MSHRAALIAELDAHKDKVIAHYAEQERQAAEEAQLRIKAERYDWLAARFAGYDFAWGEQQSVIAAFELHQAFRGGRDIGAAIDSAIAAKQ